MVYQPRNVQPSFLSIDGTENNIFTMEVATNNYINGYELTILNWDNSVFYQGTLVSLSSFAYNEDTLSISVPSSIGLVNGNNYKWYVNLYQPNNDMKITYGVIQEQYLDGSVVYIQNNINIKAGMYISIGTATQKIATYVINTTTGYATATLETAFATKPLAGDSYTIYSNFIQTVPEYILYVRENPTVSISNMPEIVSKKYFTFQGLYNQVNNVPLIYNEWQLYLINSNGGYDLIEDTGKQYNANLSFSYDGFKSGQNYAINLTIENEMGITATSGNKPFSVSYETIEYLEKPQAIMSSIYDAVQINWSTPITFSPNIYNYYKYVGTVQSGTITATSLYVETGLDITPYVDFITVNGMIINYIESYNSTTGLLTGLFSRFSNVYVGADYFISHYETNGISNISILQDTPYKNTNSAQLGEYAISYNDLANNGTIGEIPQNFNLTAQFLVDNSFFFGENNTYRNRVPLALIISGETDPLYGSIILYAHNYNIGGLWAQYNTSGVIYHQLPSATNTNQTVSLGISVDLNTTPYILFANGAYVEYITSFNSTTMIATLENPLPFIPATGDYFCLCVANETPFYSGVNELWPLQTNKLALSNGDYLWIDENNSWPTDANESSVYWVEGGGPTARITQNWWKIQLTNTNIKVEKGGI